MVCSTMAPYSLPISCLLLLPFPVHVTCCHSNLLWMPSNHLSSSLLWRNHNPGQLQLCLLCALTCTMNVTEKTCSLADGFQIRPQCHLQSHHFSVVHCATILLDHCFIHSPLLKHPTPPPSTSLSGNILVS